MNPFTLAITHYLNSFSSYLTPLLHWGQWLFLSLLTINLVWMALWHAFDQDSFADSLPIFIKKFFAMTVFYTLMIHPDWLLELLKTAQFMGETLTQVHLTPQQIIETGIQLSNKLIQPIASVTLLTSNISFIVTAFVVMLVLFVFISVALDLFVTLISTTLLISMASFFLGLAPQSEVTARQTLNSILRHCVKLLGLYLVIAVGLPTMKPLTAIVPTHNLQLDSYVWISAVVLLFLFLAKILPRQLSEIVSEFMLLSTIVTPSVNLPSTHSTLQTMESTNHRIDPTNSVIMSSSYPLGSAIVNDIETSTSRSAVPGSLSMQLQQLARKLAVTSRAQTNHKITVAQFDKK